jgi:hypothetical protein
MARPFQYSATPDTTGLFKATTAGYQLPLNGQSWDMTGSNLLSGIVSKEMANRNHAIPCGVGAAELRLGSDALDLKRQEAM